MASPQKPVGSGEPVVSSPLELPVIDVESLGVESPVSLGEDSAVELSPAVDVDVGLAEVSVLVDGPEASLEVLVHISVSQPVLPATSTV